MRLVAYLLIAVAIGMFFYTGALTTAASSAMHDITLANYWQMTLTALIGAALLFGLANIADTQKKIAQETRHLRLRYVTPHPVIKPGDFNWRGYDATLHEGGRITHQAKSKKLEFGSLSAFDDWIQSRTN